MPAPPTSTLRGRHRVGSARRVRHRPPQPRELAAVVLAGCLLAVLATWPVAARVTGHVPGDIGDPLLQAWQVAWGGHALTHQLGDVFDANAFWPLPDSLAFSDSLLGYAPAGLVGSGPAAAVVRYNLLFLFSYALCFVGGYLLARELGGSRWAAALAGVAFTLPPWKLAQIGHLHVLSAGGIPLAVALLVRGHAGVLRSGEAGRPLAAAIGWLVACWQISLGFGIGLPFAYALAVLVSLAGAGWLAAGRPALSRRLVTVDLLGASAFGAVGLLLAQPYLAVAETYPNAARTVADVTLFSPPAWGLITVPEGNFVWGDLQQGVREALPWPPEMTLAPGAVLLTLAVYGVLRGRLPSPLRIGLAGGVVLATLLALGTSWLSGRYGYLLLFDYLPGWRGLRTSGRLVLLSTLLLAVLAAGALDAIYANVSRRVGRTTAKGLAGLLILLVAVEGAGRVATVPVPSAPVDVAGLSPPIYVLTAGPVADTQVMLWSTDGFPAVVNGHSGFVPPSLARLRERVADFPSPASIEALRDRGVRTVVVPSGVRAADPAAEVAAAEAAGLAAVRRGDAVVVTLPD